MQPKIKGLGILLPITTGIDANLALAVGIPATAVGVFATYHTFAAIGKTPSTLGKIGLVFGGLLEGLFSVEMTYLTVFATAAKLGMYVPGIDA